MWANATENGEKEFSDLLTMYSGKGNKNHVTGQAKRLKNVMVSRDISTDTSGSAMMCTD
jgi:hypothetical protein